MERVYSHGYLNYLEKQKKSRQKIMFWQWSILVVTIGMWEVLARVGLIDTFLLSQPSRIVELFFIYLKDGSLFGHVGISVLETVLGFVLGMGGGIFFAMLLWWSKMLAKIMDPFLVVLNALPKTALAPILIVWAGAGVKGIVLIAMTISIVTTILSAYSAFSQIEEEKVKMLKSFGASKYQILRKLVLPANVENLFNLAKINIGLSWVGVIVGEFLVSREGIGYLIVYGGQVFRLDLVMMGVIVLAICAFLMYQGIAVIQKFCMKVGNIGGKNNL